MSKATSQEWFEMADLRRRRFSNAVWIPLRANETIKTEIDASVGSECEEIFAAASVAFPPSKNSEAERLGWSDIGLMHAGGPYAFKNKPYKPAEVYQYNDGEDLGVDLVFEQYVVGERPIWHINQDIILALHLVQEGDVWVRPEEGYQEVIRQKRNKDGHVRTIEIRSEFLRDYLAARGLSLRLAYYRQRMAILGTQPDFDWPQRGIHDTKPHDRFQTSIFEIDESGGPFGGRVAVFQTWRTDVDPDEDVPIFGREDGTNTDGRSFSYEREGKRSHRIEGELWREEWIAPANRSERVRGDEPDEQIFFATDGAGTKKPGSALNHEDIGQYLWFQPSVIESLISQRGSGLKWYTAFTGSVWCSPHDDVHFGINKLGLVNAYAYDVAKHPIWQQRIWAGHNVSPDGGVSSELLESQMRTQPAPTKAPETLIKTAIAELDDLFKDRVGSPLFRSHHATDEIAKSIHRFRAIDEIGLLSLAKDIARLIIDRMDVSVLQQFASPPPKEKWGSLKSLEKALATKVPLDRSREITSRLFGIYELRLRDAHLPSAEEIDKALAKACVDQSEPRVTQGARLIFSAAHSLHEAMKALQ